MEKMNNNITFTCSCCGAGFKGFDELKVHLTNKNYYQKNKDKGFNCEKCHKKFTTKSGLTYHQNNTVCAKTVYNAIIDIKEEISNKGTLIFVSKKPKIINRIRHKYTTENRTDKLKLMIEKIKRLNVYDDDFEPDIVYM